MSPQPSKSQTPVTDTPSVAAACNLLAKGELVAFPTETVYGLGADALNPSAVAKIYALKGRPKNHPLIVHVARWDDVTRLTHGLPEALHTLAEHFWPGPLTIIAKKSKVVPPETTGGQTSVGLRWPSHPVALALLEAYPHPIAAPSANRYQHVSPTTAQHVRDDFPDTEALPLILDGGASPIGLESTIVGWNETENMVTLLRPGHITLQQIQHHLGESIAVMDASHPQASDDTTRVSGQEAKHYAPSLPVSITTTPPANINWSHTIILIHDKNDVRWANVLRQAHTVISVGASPQAYAYTLYASLRQADTLGNNHGLEQLVIQAVPETPEWYAIANRLSRVAGAPDTPSG